MLSEDTREDISWLVKNGDRVLGPYPTSKVVELLSSREISVLDEISSPLRRWQTIQYHPEFKEVIESLRRSTLGEKTEVTLTPTAFNLTQTLTDAVGVDDLTDKLNTGEVTFTEPAKEIVIVDVAEERHTEGNAAAGRFQAQQAQGPAVQKQVEKTTRGLWFVTVGILVAVAVFVVQKRMGRGGPDGTSTLASLKRTVLTDIQTGQYVEALKELKSYYQDPTQSGDLAIYFGSLLIQVEKQTIEGRRVLAPLAESGQSEAKQAVTALGVADMIEGQLDSAQSNFEKALKIDPTFTPATMNAASVAMEKGDCSKARKLSLDAFQGAPEQGESLVLLSRAQVCLFNNEHDLSSLNEVNRMVKSFLMKHWDYQSELGVLSLYLDLLANEKPSSDKLREYLDRDPQMTADHRHNLFIFHGPMQWELLQGVCDELAKAWEDGPQVSAFMASCMSHEARWDKARSLIETAIQESPKDALVQAWYSYILKEGQEGDQASVALGRASEFNRRGEYVLPILLQARFCASNGDLDCAQETWQKIYERDLDSLPAVSGLAWVDFRKGSRREARQLMEKGLKISPDYIPLLQLRAKAEAEGWYAGN